MGVRGPAPSSHLPCSGLSPHLDLLVAADGRVVPQRLVEKGDEQLGDLRAHAVLPGTRRRLEPWWQSPRHRVGGRGRV